MKKYRNTIGISGIVALTLAATLLLLDIEKVRAQSPPTPQALSLAATRVSLTSAALTAAGVSATEASNAVNDVQAYMTENPTVFSSADAAIATARPEHDRLQRLIQGGTHAPADLAAFGTAVTNLNNALAQRETAVNSAWAAGTADLSTAKKAILTKIRTNESWGLPIEFLTVERTEAQWVALRNALANERISAQSGESPDPDAQTLLTQARSDATVSAATANLGANLAGVTAAWNSAVTD
ncbi:MAG: hypothetical protein L0Y42_10245 [Phycisphaerales bacterium]|nr:hypothetical protein [Phycisphaerales bacterium]